MLVPFFQIFPKRFKVTRCDPTDNGVSKNLGFFFHIGFKSQPPAVSSFQAPESVMLMTSGNLMISTGALPTTEIWNSPSTPGSFVDGVRTYGISGSIGTSAVQCSGLSSEASKAISLSRDIVSARARPSSASLARVRIRLMFSDSSEVDFPSMRVTDNKIVVRCGHVRRNCGFEPHEQCSRDPPAVHAFHWSATCSCIGLGSCSISRGALLNVRITKAPGWKGTLVKGITR
mmetsp:Transcript_38791/g.91863  ORF Transcript_38791/g.91863 Transcript_38791/m.91863 type:complete len:231 (-) Transcript_38791:191-883(-)